MCVCVRVCVCAFLLFPLVSDTKKIDAATDCTRLCLLVKLKVA